MFAYVHFGKGDPELQRIILGLTVVVMIVIILAQGRKSK
jgi:hypothetical protein